MDIRYPLFRLERSNSTTIAEFKESGNGVLLASGALWEGIDIPGDTLSMLVIVKLPFQVPDAISEYEQSLYPDFPSYLNEILVPDMLIKLKQGFGRLIRSESDTGVVAILDYRVNGRGSYRQRVLDTLPSCPVTDSMGDVREFYRVKKGSEYFI
jgi:ATP-dependent DNA helicase DinG